MSVVRGNGIQGYSAMQSVPRFRLVICSSLILKEQDGCRIPSPAVERKHPKAKPIRDPALFEMEKLELAGDPPMPPLCCLVAAMA